MPCKEALGVIAYTWPEEEEGVEYAYATNPLFHSMLALLDLLLGQFSQGATNTLVQGITHHLPGQLHAIELIYATYFLSSVPGVAGLIALLLIFFYYFAAILLIGAEVNAYFVEGVYPMPNDVVAFATTMAGKLIQDMPEREAQTHVDTQPTEQADTEHALDVENKTAERDGP